jgi:GH15 family glucan-1,4-alpha-glucosidase
VRGGLKEGVIAFCALELVGECAIAGQPNQLRIMYGIVGERWLPEHEIPWHQPDQGIWEMQGQARHFTHSKLMCWVSFDRAIKAVERFGLKRRILNATHRLDRLYCRI